MPNSQRPSRIQSYDLQHLDLVTGEVRTNLASTSLEKGNSVQVHALLNVSHVFVSGKGIIFLTFGTIVLNQRIQTIQWFNKMLFKKKQTSKKTLIEAFPSSFLHKANNIASNLALKTK